MIGASKLLDSAACEAGKPKVLGSEEDAEFLSLVGRSCTLCEVPLKRCLSKTSAKES